MLDLDTSVIELLRFTGRGDKVPPMLCPKIHKNDSRCYLQQEAPEARRMVSAFCYDQYKDCVIYKDMLRAEEPPAPLPLPLPLPAPEPASRGSDLDLGALKHCLRQVLAEQELQHETPLGERYRGGTLVLCPKDTSLQSKEIPIEAFFAKIVGVRERLRVLEQKINNHDHLSDEDKLTMQQYITRCYGSLTTFNILFKDKADQFRGESGKA